MLTLIKWLFILVVVLALVLLAAGQLGFLRGKAPTDLGVPGGKLKAPALTPNSVSSQADLWPNNAQRGYAKIAPLAAAGSAEATMTKLKAIVSAMPGAEVINASDGYLYATFTTQLLKFTDDVEFWWDDSAAVVQVRSASRLGRKDFGVNRARVEAIRARLGSGATP
jgi:uncharacterized protein (DUF1499 family)